MRWWATGGLVFAACSFNGGEPSDEGQEDAAPLVDAAGDDAGASPTSCLALPVNGTLRMVSTTNELVATVDSLNSGDVVLIADGTYDVSLEITVDNVEIRSQSGNAEAVRLASIANQSPVVIEADNVVITALTIVSQGNGIELDSFGQNVTGTRIYDVNFDVDNAGVLIPGGPLTAAIDTEIACSTFEVSDRDALTCTIETVAIAASGSSDLRINQNRFVDFSCEDVGRDTRAIEVEGNADTTIVTRNEFIRPGIALMLGEDAAGIFMCSSDPEAGAHRLGIACSNVVWDNGELTSAGQEYFDTGFASWAACGSVFVHNTIYAPPSFGFSSLEGRYANSSTLIANNLASLGTNDRQDADTTELTNTTDATESTFVDAQAADLRPVAPTLPATDLSNEALLVTHCSLDFDGNQRDLANASRGAFEVAK